MYHTIQSCGSGGDKIELVLTDDLKFKSLEKYNFSYYTASAWLTPEQIHKTSNSPVTEIEVFWKKETEQYKLQNRAHFIDALKLLLKDTKY